MINLTVNETKLPNGSRFEYEINGVKMGHESVNPINYKNERGYIQLMIKLNMHINIGVWDDK